MGLLEETSIPPIDEVGFRPEKAVKVHDLTPTETAFFDYMFTQMTCGNDSKLLNLSEVGFMLSTVLSAIPIESTLDDISFSFTALRSKHHDPNINGSILCPMSWWLNNANKQLEHTYVTKVDSSIHKRLMNRGTVVRSGDDIMVHMYASLFGASHVVSVVATWSKVV